MPAKRNRFFWLEGVTEREVTQSLNDENPSRLRTHKVRRLMVISIAATTCALGLLVLWPDTKLRSYLEFAGLASSIVLYLLIRKSVRLIADAPNDLLDERQIAVRDAAHTTAYRILSIVSVAFMIIFSLADPLQRGIPLIFGFLMLAVSLPSMVLAWRLPSEEILRSE